MCYTCVMDAFCIPELVMATLTIKNLPDELYASLTRAAHKNRRSINSEAIVSVERGVDRSDTDSHLQLLDDIRRDREEMARRGLWVTDEDLRVSRAELERRPTTVMKELSHSNARAKRSRRVG